MLKRSAGKKIFAQPMNSGARKRREMDGEFLRTALEINRPRARRLNYEGSIDNCVTSGVAGQGTGDIDRVIV